MPAQKYALLNPRTGEVRRVANLKISDAALPVTYPDLDIDRRAYKCKQNPPREWAVFADRVEVTYTITPLDLEIVKKAKREETRRLRYSKEVAGVTLQDGTSVATDRGSQQRLTSLVAAINTGLLRKDVPFEIQPGKWTVASHKKIIEMAQAATDHVQECFSRCSRLHALIDACPNVIAVMEFDPESNWDVEALNINTASEDAIKGLDGVGASLAKKIIAGRQWTNVNEITTIPGISQNMVDEWDITT